MWSLETKKYKVFPDILGFSSLDEPSSEIRISDIVKKKYYSVPLEPISFLRFVYSPVSLSLAIMEPYICLFWSPIVQDPTFHNSHLRLRLWASSPASIFFVSVCLFRLNLHETAHRWGQVRSLCGWWFDGLKVTKDKQGIEGIYSYSLVILFCT